MDSIGFETHDHSSCIHDCIAAVDARCKAKGLQFTPVRRRVLEILLQEHRALQQRAQKGERPESRPEPPRSR